MTTQSATTQPNHSAERAYFRPDFSTGRHALQCPGCGLLVVGAPRTAMTKVQKHYHQARAAEQAQA